jgi:hypothetical protein
MYRARGNGPDYQSDTRGIWSKLLTTDAIRSGFIEPLGNGRGRRSILLQRRSQYRCRARFTAG